MADPEVVKQNATVVFGVETVVCTISNPHAFWEAYVMNRTTSDKLAGGNWRLYVTGTGGVRSLIAESPVSDNSKPVRLNFSALDIPAGNTFELAVVGTNPAQGGKNVTAVLVGYDYSTPNAQSTVHGSSKLPAGQAEQILATLNLEFQAVDLFLDTSGLGDDPATFIVYATPSSGVRVPIFTKSFTRGVGKLYLGRIEDCSAPKYELVGISTSGRLTGFVGASMTGSVPVSAAPPIPPFPPAGMQIGTAPNASGLTNPGVDGIPSVAPLTETPVISWSATTPPADVSDWLDWVTWLGFTGKINRGIIEFGQETQVAQSGALRFATPVGSREVLMASRNQVTNDFQSIINISSADNGTAVSLEIGREFWDQTLLYGKTLIMICNSGPLGNDGNAWLFEQEGFSYQATMIANQSTKSIFWEWSMAACQQAAVTTSIKTGKGTELLYQAGESANADGGDYIARSGFNAAGGTTKHGHLKFQLHGGFGPMQSMIEVAELVAGERIVTLCQGLDITITDLPAGSGDLVMHLGEAAVAPTVPPNAGFTFYVDPYDHNLKVIGAGGTVTQLASSYIVNSIAGNVLWLRSDFKASLETSNIVATGTAPPAITATGTPANVIQEDLFKVEIQTTGILGVATFRWSTDNGVTWQESNVVTSATHVLGITGVTLHFPAGTYTNDDVYTFQAVVGSWGDNSAVPDPNKTVTATGIARPIFDAQVAALNNHTGLKFDGVATTMKSGVWNTPVPTPSTLFIVTDLAAGNGLYIDSLTGAQRYEMLNNGTMEIDIEQNALAQYTTTADVRGAHVYCCEFNGATSKVYQDSLTALASAATDAGTSTPTGITLGSSFAASAFLNGFMAEVIIYQGILSAGDRTKIMNYLGARYNITIAP